MSFSDFKSCIFSQYPKLAGEMTSMNDLQQYLDQQYPNECQVIMKNEPITKPIAIIGVLDLKLPTTHWTVLLRNTYIDSFGLVPPVDVLKQVATKLDYVNIHKFQKFNSSLCGIYCLYMIYVFKNNAKMLNKVIANM